MKKFLIASLVAACALPAFAAVPDEVANMYPGYKLEFDQEFDEVVSLDSIKKVWNFEMGWKRNNEHQCYVAKDSNTFIQDGHLYIRALSNVKNPMRDKYNKNFNGQPAAQYVFTSASMQSKWRGHYGIWVTRAKIPVGTGYWPAIWGTGNTRGWPSAGELDIMEYYGNAIHANLCWGSGGGTWSSQAPSMSTFASDFASQYHTWVCEWDHDYCRIYLDGRLLNETDLDRTVNSDGYNPFRDENNTYQVWLNLALGGNNGGNPWSGKYPADYIIDYARVYTPITKAAPLVRRLAIAEELYNNTREGDGPGEYPTSARNSFAGDIEAAKLKINSEDYDEIDTWTAKVRDAISRYKKQANPPIAPNEKFALRHTASGCVLSNGWYNNNRQILLLDAHQKDYNQEYIFVPAPEGAEATGYNLMTADGNYVYRTSWNLFYSDDATKRKTRDYIFTMEMDGDKILIKNAGSGKYFGSDGTTAWSCLYSDKAGEGNEKAWFELVDLAGVENVAVSDINPVSAVYNLQGVYIAPSLDTVPANGSVYIVRCGNMTSKVIR